MSFLRGRVCKKQNGEGGSCSLNRGDKQQYQKGFPYAVNGDRENFEHGVCQDKAVKSVGENRILGE